MNDNYYRKYEPVFGSWYIKEKIGEGTYGKVYSIECEEGGNLYTGALKTITIPGSESEVISIMSEGLSRDEAEVYFRELVTNIEDEIKLTSVLKGCKGIVGIDEYGVYDHKDGIGWDILIRMELLVTLAELTSKEFLSEEETVRLGIDICGALEECRRHNIIHRDIKPENIFIAGSGEYKLGDFGVARAVDRTQEGLSRKGTATYMAPEVYRADAYGPSVDIYSLGLVMYRLMNQNRLPFLPDYPGTISYNMREDAVSRRLKGETLPPPAGGNDELRRIILKACSFSSADRYHSASEMKRDLELVKL